jgi:AcrR family transcriptional regulator
MTGGPEAIRLQKIAGDIGLSHPAILHHFENREGLVEALVIDGLSRLQTQFLEGWASEKEPDLEGIFDRFYDVASRRGIARLLAWLILSGRDLGAMKPGVLRPATERMHAGRVRRAQRGGCRVPQIEETQFAATFLVILVLGDSLFGTTARRAVGLRSDGATTRRFRGWLIAIIERLGTRG